MKLLHNLETGNPVTTRRAFYVLAILGIIACLVAKMVFHVDFISK